MLTKYRTASGAGQTSHFMCGAGRPHPTSRSITERREHMNISTRAEIVEGLANILEEVAGVNPSDVAEDKAFAADLDVDSLSMVEIVVAAEEIFHIKISDDEWQALTTVGLFTDFVEKAQASA